MANILNVKRTIEATYDFAVSGGVVGDIGLGVFLPDNAVVTDLMIDEVTALTTAGGSATISLELGVGADSPGALFTLLAFAAGFVPGANYPTILAGVTAKTTKAAELSLTIAVADLTAGKLRIYVEYVVSE